MKRFLSLLLILCFVFPGFAAETVVYNTQNSFVVPWVATDRTDFKTAETGLTMSAFVVKAYKRNKAPITITIAACVFAASTLTSTGTVPANNDTLTIAGTLNGTSVSRVYTYKTTLTGAANEILIGASAAAALDNTKSAINATAGEGTTYGTGTLINQLVNATTNTDTTQVIVSNIPGTGSNAYTTAEASAQLSWTGSTLASGNDNCMLHESAGRHWFAGPTTLFDTLGPMSLTFNYDAEALPFEVLLDVVGQTSFDARYVSVASGDDYHETDCSTIANTNSPSYKACAQDALTKLYSAWKNPTTIATLASQTSFTLTDGSADNDAYKHWMILVVDQSTPLQMAKAVVSAYTGATKTVTLLTDPAVFTMATGDAVYLMPDPSLKPTVDNRTVDITSTGEAGVDLSTVNGTLDASEIGADAVTAAKLASDVATEIQTGLLTVPKNTIYNNFTFEMVDAIDGTTLETGLTVTCQVAKDGALLAACTNAPTEVGSGLYKMNVAAADLNADEVWIRLTASGARRLSFKIRTQK